MGMSPSMHAGVTAGVVCDCCWIGRGKSGVPPDKELLSFQSLDEEKNFMTSAFAHNAHVCRPPWVTKKDLEGCIARPVQFSFFYIVLCRCKQEFLASCVLKYRDVLRHRQTSLLKIIMK